MTKQVVVLGGGTGGTMIANRLRRMLPLEKYRIIVIDRDNRHLYQPGLLFLPFGMLSAADIVKDRAQHLLPGVDFLEGEVEQVEVIKNRVRLAHGQLVSYDVLVVASGVRLQPEETQGLTADGWRRTVFDFYSLEGAAALHEALGTWRGGNLAINIVDLPIKCPVAPLEFAFLLDWYLQERGLREITTISYVTPLDGAFTKPVAAKALGQLLDHKHIELVTEFNAGSVDGGAGILRSYDGREHSFDLLITVPLHAGPEFVTRSEGLGDEFGFVAVNPKTLQSEAAPNIFAIGDVASLPTSKAGSVTHFESEVLGDNILEYLIGKPPSHKYDGHANCFVETGFGKALLIDFNYDTEPVPGHFPFAFGPLPLLKESRLNHFGKLAFQWFYWNMLLTGRHIPGLPPQMSRSGKEITDHA